MAVETARRRRLNQGSGTALVNRETPIVMAKASVYSSGQASGQLWVEASTLIELRHGCRHWVRCGSPRRGYRTWSRCWRKRWRLQSMTALLGTMEGMCVVIFCCFLINQDNAHNFPLVFVQHMWKLFRNSRCRDSGDIASASVSFDPFLGLHACASEGVAQKKLLCWQAQSSPTQRNGVHAHQVDTTLAVREAERVQGEKLLARNEAVELHCPRHPPWAHHRRCLRSPQPLRLLELMSLLALPESVCH